MPGAVIENMGARMYENGLRPRGCAATGWPRSVSAAMRFGR